MPRVFLTKRAEFSAAHLHLPPAAHLHGHNYLLEVTVGGEVEPRTGMVVNLSDVKRDIQSVLDAFDHKNLTADVPQFAGLIPTTERLASVLWRLLEPRLPGLARVRLSEGSGICVDYAADRGRDHMTAPSPAAGLTRVYRFSSAHRLFSPAFTEEENRALYGKCSGLHGHGHDYTLEVTLAAPPPPDGAHVPPGHAQASSDADHLVAAQVVEAFDHRHLNQDVEEFRRIVPTAENILIVTWERLVKRLPPGLLCRLRLVETRDNAFEYYG